jgi:hypothetical protein
MARTWTACGAAGRSSLDGSQHKANAGGDEMDEIYSMLGREREADLEREAVKRRLAGQARGRQEASNPEREIDQEPRPGRLFRTLIAPLHCAVRTPTPRRLRPEARDYRH